MKSYESLLQLVASVPNAASADHRDVTWVTGAHVVGVARNHDGQIELFLAGARLSPGSATVSSAIEFRTWHREGAASFHANRLLFPSFGYFDQIAAFICTELLRVGADASLVHAFARCEPLIEMALEKLRLSSQAMLGLAGELLLLDALCRRISDGQVGRVIESWDGWKKSSRDFSWGSTGVEVKTTVRNVSSHPVEGIHQVERNDGSNGEEAEEKLLLVSIGLEPAEPGYHTFSIPELVERIVVRVDEAGAGTLVIEKLLARIVEYGGSPGGGYNHGSQASDPFYSTSYLTSIFRAYDMSDEAVEVLRRDDVAIRNHVNVDSVKFLIELPISVGLDNPVIGANRVADAILGLRP